MDSIRAAVLDTLQELDVTKEKIFIKDKGALDCVIRARMETALKRGGVEEKWDEPCCFYREIPRIC